MYFHKSKKGTTNMGLLKKENKYPSIDFNACVLEYGIVPTRIYTKRDLVGFSVKGRSIFGNSKRHKPFKI